MSYYIQTCVPWLRTNLIGQPKQHHMYSYKKFAVEVAILSCKAFASTHIVQ
mgnify:CR=1 FL=1